MKKVIEDFMLVKILKKEYVESLLNGKLYMNNLKYFVDLEKETKKQGIGDIREASIANVRKHKLFIQREGEEVVEIDIGDAPGILYDDNALYHPVFCAIGKIIKYDRVDDKRFGKSLALTELELEDFVDADSSQQAVIITDVYKFLNRVHLAMKKSHISGKYGMVQYRDMSVPNFNDGNWILDSTFVKDIRFKKQSEFRIELYLHEKNPFVLDIGDIKDIAFAIEYEVLLNGVYIQCDKNDEE